jgi:hypothetical protein
MELEALRRMELEALRRMELEALRRMELADPMTSSGRAAGLPTGVMLAHVTPARSMSSSTLRSILHCVQNMGRTR